MKDVVEILTEIEDFRKARGKRYELVVILTMAVVAIMCGCKSYSAIAQWGRDYKGEITQALGFRRKTTPCKATLYRIFKNVKIEEIEEKLGKYFQEIMKQERKEKDIDIEVVAADGKTLRGSKKQGSKISQLMSVVSHKLGLTIAQESISTKSNEIPKLQEIVGKMDLENIIVTMDALNTQKQTAQAIVEAAGEYLMIVKENQKQLYDDISIVFDANANANEIETVEQTNIGHGRIETRKLSTSSILSSYLDWPGVEQVFRLERYTYFKKSGKERHNVVYGITSLPHAEFKAEDLLGISRGHWSIENRSHWVRDVTFDEDRSQVRSGNIAQLMACFRNLVIGLFRFFGFSNIASTCRSFAANPWLALSFIGISEN